MSNGRFRCFRSGRILALLASGIVAGIVARAYAIAMPKMSGGVPSSLTFAGEVSFFMLGAVAASFAMFLIADWPGGREMLDNRSRTFNLALGIVIGLVFGAMAVPLFSFTFLTAPGQVTDFLMK